MKDNNTSKRAKSNPGYKNNSLDSHLHTKPQPPSFSGLQFPTYVLAYEKIKYIRGERRLIDPSKCLLCEVVKKNPIIPSWEVFRDQKTLVMLNAYPFNTGHLMVIPLVHYEQYEELPEELLLHLNQMLQRCIHLLRSTYAPRGFNVGINQGNWGGASIAHLHIHVVPRYGVDMNFMEVIGGTRVVVEPLKDTLQTLQAQVTILDLNKSISTDSDG
ncbi:MAG: HIT family protein [Candidatus Hodarchaeota archaeon]